MKQTWCNVAAFQILAKPCPFNWRQLFEPTHIYPEAEERYNTIMMMSSFSERAGGIVREKMEPMSLGSPTSSPSSPPSWGSGPPLHSLSLTSPIAPYHHHGAYNSPLQQPPYGGFNTPQQQQQPVQHPHQQQQQQTATQSGFLPGFLMGEPVKHEITTRVPNQLLATVVNMAIFSPVIAYLPGHEPLLSDLPLKTEQNSLLPGSPISTSPCSPSQGASASERNLE